MSERAPQPNPESMPKSIETSQEYKRPAHNKTERIQTNQEKQETISKARNEVKKEAKNSGDIKLDHGGEQSHATAAPISRELKTMMRIRTLTRIQKELPGPKRVLSKVIHAKPVEAVSVVGEKTIARPIGLLGGGLVAFIGSLVTLYAAKHYGFRYNLLLFFLLFIAGYLVATGLEILYKTTNRK